MSINKTARKVLEEWMVEFYEERGTWDIDIQETAMLEFTDRVAAAVLAEPDDPDDPCAKCNADKGMCKFCTVTPGAQP